MKSRPSAAATRTVASTTAMITRDDAKADNLGFFERADLEPRHENRTKRIKMRGQAVKGPGKTPGVPQ